MSFTPGDLDEREEFLKKLTELSNEHGYFIESPELLHLFEVPEGEKGKYKFTSSPFLGEFEWEEDR